MHLEDHEVDTLQTLKAWWQKYGMFFSVTVLILAVAFFSFQYWQRYQLRTRIAASHLYQTWITQTAESSDASTILQQLIAEYPRTVYAQMAALFLAQQAVQQKQYDTAVKQLTWVRKKASDETIQEIATLRLARVLLAQKKYNDALALVNQPVRTAYEVVANDVKGDVLWAMGDKAKAHAAYNEAFRAAPRDSEIRKTLTMKLSETALATRSLQPLIPFAVNDRK